MATVRIKSKRVLRGDNGGIGPGVLEITNGKITSIIEGENYNGSWDSQRVSSQVHYSHSAANFSKR